MEQRDIEIFLTLADELHFGRAAERLHVSTARVSQTIKKLEQRIGAPLFERTSRRVEMTALGRGLDDELRPAHQQIQDAVERATAAARGVHGTLRVGFVGAATGQFVLEVAEAFRVEYLDCEVRFHEKQFGAGLGPLRGGEFDMLLATVPVFGAREADLTGGSLLFEEDRLVCERVYFDANTILRQLGIAHDPLTLKGRVATVLNHPLTVGRAVIGGLLHR